MTPGSPLDASTPSGAPGAVEAGWIVTDGSIGMENQCLGLAEALGIHPLVKRVSLRAPWGILPPQLRPLRAYQARPRVFGVEIPEGGELEPPWPDLLISCGRTSVGCSIAIRRLSRGRTFTVHIQNPHLASRYFDAVVPPEHDGLAGPGVIPTRGALHRVTPARLEEAARRFGPRLAHLPRPRLSVLVGGTSRHHRLTASGAALLAAKLLGLVQSTGAGLMVTTSRRTAPEAEAVLRRRLAGEAVAFWEGEGENPYFAYLALADAIVVTSDSVAMISEACATGKPVYVVELEGRGSKRLRRFLDDFAAAGMVRPFTGALESWSYTPLDERARVAAEIRRHLEAR